MYHVFNPSSKFLVGFSFCNINFCCIWSKCNALFTYHRVFQYYDLILASKKTNVCHLHLVFLCSCLLAFCFIRTSHWECFRSNPIEMVLIHLENRNLITWISLMEFLRKSLQIDRSVHLGTCSYDVSMFYYLWSRFKLLIIIRKKKLLIFLKTCHVYWFLLKSV